MGRFSTRLTARVVLIVFMVIVPALGVIVYDQMSERRRAREDAVENASRLAHLAVTEQSRIFGGVQRLLTTLAMFPGLREKNAAACRALLPGVLRDHPNYINIFIVQPDGSQFCAATNLPMPHSAKQSAWFARVMQTRAMAMGDYQISLMNGRPAVVLAQPLFDESGHIERIVAAVVSLDGLNGTFSQVKLPAGATLTLTDRQGTILARTPDAANWIGRRHTQFPAGRQTGGDQRVAFPSAARVAEEHADVLRNMRRVVDGDDADAVHDLVADHELRLRLDDLQVRLIGRADHRRAFVAPRDATLAEAARIGGIGRSVQARFGRPRGDDRLRGRRQIGNPAIGRIVDERRPVS